MTFFTEAIIYQHFQQVTYLPIDFVKLQTLVVFFLCFSAFSEFQCHFHKNTFFLTFIMKYLLHFRLKGVKIHKIRKKYFLQTSNKFAIQNNPLILLLLIFHKTN